jgi:hypothetical protein
LLGTCPAGLVKGPSGQLSFAHLPLRPALSHAALERFTARAIREERKLEAIVQEILEDAGVE